MSEILDQHALTTPPATNGHTSKVVEESLPAELHALEVRLDRQETRRDNLTLFLVVFAAMSLITSIVAIGLGVRAVNESKDNAGGGGDEATAAAPATATVTLSEFRIAPAEFTIAAGGTINVVNSGSIQHDLGVRDTELMTPLIDPGGSASLALTGLAAGTYTLICHIAGHEQAGMSGTVRIVEAGAGAQASGSPVPAAGHDSMMTVDEMDEHMLATTKAYPASTAGLGAQPLAPTVVAGGVKQFELTTNVVKWELSPGKFVDAWTYNGTVPGPTIKVNPGDKVRVVLNNQLPQSTAIHFHGLVTPNAMDGVPGITQEVVKPGATFAYEFTAQSTPAVGMYHSHQDAVKQVPNGLAGAFLVGELPVPSGVKVTQEHVMMLNDAGTIGYAINGKSFPATAPIAAGLGEWIEVHYMNEGQMIHPMHLHGIPQMVIAKDGFPLASPQLQDTIMIAPGERYTVLIHADNPGTWAWHCHILSHAEDSTGMFGMVTALAVK